jgi:hypothetical protein
MKYSKKNKSPKHEVNSTLDSIVKPRDFESHNNVTSLPTPGGRFNFVKVIRNHGPHQGVHDKIKVQDVLEKI